MILGAVSGARIGGDGNQEVQGLSTDAHRVHGADRGGDLPENPK